MAVILADLFGSPNIGVYSFCNEQLVIVPPGLTNHKMNQFAETLGVNVCKTTIGGSTLVGALVTGNSRGVLVPRTIHDYELDRLRQYSEVTVIDSKWTALGNVILANDFGAVIHPDSSTEIRSAVAEKLGVKPIEARIGTLPFVGSLGITSNKGAIISINALSEERLVVESALKVEVETGTTNGGVPFVHSGILANSKGAVIGPLTRGAELMQITRMLDV
jgi:translation initiation factor 6